MLALGDRLYKFAGKASIGWDYTGGQKSGSITDSRFTQYAGCQPFWFIIAGGFNPRWGGVSFSISGNTLTWNYQMPQENSSTRPNTTFVYGIW